MLVSVDGDDVDDDDHDDNGNEKIERSHLITKKTNYHELIANASNKNIQYSAKNFP